MEYDEKLLRTFRGKLQKRFEIFLVREFLDVPRGSLGAFPPSYCAASGCCLWLGLPRDLDTKWFQASKFYGGRQDLRTCSATSFVICRVYSTVVLRLFQTSAIQNSRTAVVYPVAAAMTPRDETCYAFRVTWPEPKPCKRKYGRVPFEQMLRHIREDKCEQCRALVLYLERESEIDTYLRRSRN
jgi:hypothetical protein